METLDFKEYLFRFRKVKKKKEERRRRKRKRRRFRYWMRMRKIFTEYQTTPASDGHSDKLSKFGRCPKNRTSWQHCDCEKWAMKIRTVKRGLRKIRTVKRGLRKIRTVKRGL